MEQCCNSAPFSLCNREAEPALELFKNALALLRCSLMTLVAISLILIDSMRILNIRESMLRLMGVVLVSSVRAEKDGA